MSDVNDDDRQEAEEAFLKFVRALARADACRDYELAMKGIDPLEWLLSIPTDRERFAKDASAALADTEGGQNRMTIRPD